MNVKRDSPYLLVVTVLTGLVGAFLLIFGAPIISTHLLGASSLSGSVALAGGVVFFATMNGFQVGALAGLEQYRRIAIVGLVCASLHLALCAGLALLGGLQGVIVGLVISAAVRWLLFNMALRKEAAGQGIQITMRSFSRESSVLVTFAVPASLGGVSALLAIWIANALLVRQENGFTQMGLYAAANSLRALVLFVPALINGVGVSVINGFANARHLEEYRAAFWANFWITCVSLIVGAAALALAGEALLSLFGREFIAAHLMLNIMIAGAVVEGMGIAAYQVVQSRSRMWLSLGLISLPRDFLLVMLAWILVPLHGALGLAVTYAISSSAALFAVLVITLRIGLAHPPGGVQNH